MGDYGIADHLQNAFATKLVGEKGQEQQCMILVNLLVKRDMDGAMNSWLSNAIRNVVLLKA